MSVLFIMFRSPTVVYAMTSIWNSVTRRRTGSGVTSVMLGFTLLVLGYSLEQFLLNFTVRTVREVPSEVLFQVFLCTLKISSIYGNNLRKDISQKLQYSFSITAPQVARKRLVLQIGWMAHCFIIRGARHELTFSTGFKKWIKALPHIYYCLQGKGAHEQWPHFQALCVCCLQYEIRTEDLGSFIMWCVLQDMFLRQQITLTYTVAHVMWWMSPGLLWISYCKRRMCKAWQRGYINSDTGIDKKRERKKCYLMLRVEPC